MSYLLTFCVGLSNMTCSERFFWKLEIRRFWVQYWILQSKLNQKLIFFWGVGCQNRHIFSRFFGFFPSYICGLLRFALSVPLCSWSLLLCCCYTTYKTVLLLGSLAPFVMDKRDSKWNTIFNSVHFVDVAYHILYWNAQFILGLLFHFETAVPILRSCFDLKSPFHFGTDLSFPESHFILELPSQIGNVLSIWKYSFAIRVPNLCLKTLKKRPFLNTFEIFLIFFIFFLFRLNLWLSIIYVIFVWNCIVSVWKKIV